VAFHADRSRAQVSAVVRRPCSTERPLAGAVLRAASSTPWQIAPTGSSRANASATTRCSSALSR
jgi:hypothetical protein